MFAHQWVRSCLAVNSETGLLQWVVDGILVENATVPQVKDTQNKPTDLSGKIVLGVTQKSGGWESRISNQVTNLNIFSTALTIGEMQQITLGGDCSPDGDYLAWKDMQWKVKGQARIETVNVKEPCLGDPYLNIYSAPHSSMESCSHFCQKLGSRSPPVDTQKQWTNLQKGLEGVTINRTVPSEIWLALDDSTTEGTWVDFYDDTVVNFSLPWIPGEPIICFRIDFD